MRKKIKQNDNAHLNSFRTENSTKPSKANAIKTKQIEKNAKTQAEIIAQL